MSTNPELNEIVTLPVAEPAPEPTNGHRAELAVAQEPEAPPIPAVAAPAKRSRPSWRGSLAVGVVALIASGSLGYLLYSTTQERNATQVALAGTQAQLKDSQTKLELANSDAATKLITAKYVALYTKDQGRVQIDYETFMRCNSFGACRTASQNLVNDIGQFQSDRKAANVPTELVGADRDLGDALSSAYAAAAQIVSAMDSASVSRFTAGIKKLDAAMLALGKVQFGIGGQLSL
jgi:hypothetical protein